jgi:hypothetical protein
MKKENKIRPSDFYWGLCMILASILLVGGYILDNSYLLFSALIIFTCGLIINHNKKIKNEFDYEEK